MCTVVRVAQAPGVDTVRFVRKPSALVPWADPYIAGLVRRLQSEVRQERAAASAKPVAVSTFDNRGACQWLNQSLAADLDPPSPGDFDWEWPDATRWTFENEASD